jgi:hypothetical protein
VAFLIDDEASVALTGSMGAMALSLLELGIVKPHHRGA